jgi:hypothetical protein
MHDMYDVTEYLLHITKERKIPSASTMRLECKTMTTLRLYERPIYTIPIPCLLTNRKKSTITHLHVLDSAANYLFSTKRRCIAR